MALPGNLLLLLDPIAPKITPEPLCESLQPISSASQHRYAYSALHSLGNGIFIITTINMDMRKEPIISAALLLLFFVLRALYPESAVTASMVVALLLIVRALYVYWLLIDAVIKEDTKKGMDADLTGLYMLVRFYKRHGWPAMIGTLGNVTLASLIFIGSVMSLQAV